MKPLKVDGVGILAVGVTALILMIFVIVGGISPQIITNSCGTPCLELQDLSAQFSMAQAAWAMVVVSLIGTTVGAITLIVVYQTLIAARATAEASKEAVEVADRNGRRQIQAYLQVTEATAEITNLLTKIRISVKNFGQSPARRLQITAEVGFDDHPDLKPYKATIYIPSIATGSTETGGDVRVYNLITKSRPLNVVVMKIHMQWIDVFDHVHEEVTHAIWLGDAPPPKNLHVFSIK